MRYALGATYYRTALLLGLVRGERVQRWAEEAIARETEPPAALIDVETSHDRSRLFGGFGIF